MADLILKDVAKSYGPVNVLANIDLEIEKGELVVFVGPSGCGKSTLLRMIAGLEHITSGTLEIDGTLVNDVPPSERGIAMVFQSYALYPHLTVRENMSFALKIAKMSTAEINERVEKAAKTLQLHNLLDRLPKALSGGQRQRVAIGRSIVRDPKVYLFDEPLSNLDAELRVDMRVEIARLHQEIGATMIYVTHDRIEAMTLATKIVVLKGGVVQQIGTPAEIYNRPANLFVADFMGSPAMNLIPAKATKNGTGTQIEIAREGAAPLMLTDTHAENLPQDVILGLRPEDIAEAGFRAGEDVQVAECHIDMVEPAGADTFVVSEPGGKPVTAGLPAEPGAQRGQPLPRGV